MATSANVKLAGIGRVRRRVATALAIALAAAAFSAAVPQHGSAALLSKETFNPTSGPLGPISVIGDSVMLGSIIYSPTLSDQLAQRGWGPIRVRAGGGYSTGAFAVPAEARSSYWITEWRRQGWDPQNVVVNIGGNDSGFCTTNLSCARNAIMHLVDTIGPGHRIWWPKVTHHWVYTNWATNWNTALDQIAAERDDFFTWDWPAVMVAGGFVSSDNIHLSPTDYRRRSVLMGYEITADLAEGSRTGGDVALPQPAGPQSELIAVNPTRIIDTRIDPPGHVAAKQQIVVDVSADVPEGATAVAAYVSATNTGGPGYLTAYECSTGRPTASSVNYLGGETRGALAIVPLSATREFCLFSLADADLLVDLQAAFVPLGSGGTRLTPLTTPTRLVDTRLTGRHDILEVPVPAGAEAVAINLTAVNGDAPGFLVAYACSDVVPKVATVNHLANEATAGAAFVKVGLGGTICVKSKAPVDVVIDLTGVFTTGGDLAFVPVPPTRMIDTRNGTGGWSPILGQFQIIDARVAPATAKAVSGTITIVAPMRTGFLRAWGCGEQPTTSNVNSSPGGVLANSVTTGVSGQGRLCMFARSSTGALFDTTGWWVTGADPEPQPVPQPVPQPQPQPQRVVMFTDSVGLGAANALPRAFPADWSVHVDGAPARFVEQLESDFVKPRLATNPDWFGKHVVIAAGYNYPYWDPQRFDRSIDSIVNTLTAAGVEHVYWVLLREIDPQYISGSAWRQIQPYYWYFPTVNDHLEAALERHPNLTLVDWRAAANRPGITYDAIHLNNTGAELYSNLIRQTIDAASTRVKDQTMTKVHVPGGEGAAAAAVNLTTTDPRTAGFLKLHRCDEPVPATSMHNYVRAETAAHSGVVPLDPNGDFCVTTRVATNLIVDITGIFPSGAGFEPVAATRWFDSRTLAGRQPIPGGSTIQLDIDDIRSQAGVTGSPRAVVVAATATEAQAPGWLRVVTCGSNATTSNVNYQEGAASPNLVVVAPDANGKICITTLASTHVVVDLFGVFAATAEVKASTASRVFDSRLSGQRVAAGSVTVIDVAAAGVDASANGVILNLTATDELAPGYATAYPCATGRPTASNVNVGGGRVVSNAAILAPDTNGKICVFSLSSMHLIVDVMGEFGSTFEGRRPVRALDTRG